MDRTVSLHNHEDLNRCDCGERATVHGYGIKMCQDCWDELANLQRLTSPGVLVSEEVAHA